jgi:hypothetical protein
VGCESSFTILCVSSVLESILSHLKRLCADFELEFDVIPAASCRLHLDTLLSEGGNTRLDELDDELEG